VSEERTGGIGISGIGDCVADFQDSLLREVRFPDTTREIIEDHSVGVRTFDKGVEEQFQLFGPVKKKVLVIAIILRGVGKVASEWYQSGNIFAFCSREEKTSCRREEKGSHLIRKTGMCEEEVGQQEIQKWSAK
jgi:hypothetical protein